MGFLFLGRTVIWLLKIIQVIDPSMQFFNSHQIQSPGEKSSQATNSSENRSDSLSSSFELSNRNKGGLQQQNVNNNNIINNNNSKNIKKEEPKGIKIVTPSPAATKRIMSNSHKYKNFLQMDMM